MQVYAFIFLFIPIFTFKSTTVQAENITSIKHQLLRDKREVLSNHDYRFEVNIGMNDRRVLVSTLKSNNDLPHEMSITIFSDPDTSQTIQLEALGIESSLPSDKPNELPKYQGYLTQNVGSYIGVEVRFAINANSIKVLRSFPVSRIQQ